MPLILSSHRVQCSVLNTLHYWFILRKQWLSPDMTKNVLTRTLKLKPTKTQYTDSFRISSHRLQVEKGRHQKIARNERKCAVCQSEVEDEYHLLMVCPLYNDIRLTYIPRDYTNNRNTYNFISLMKTQDEELLRNVAAFLYYAFQRRDNLT